MTTTKINKIDDKNYYTKFPMAFPINASLLPTNLLGSELFKEWGCISSIFSFCISSLISSLMIAKRSSLKSSNHSFVIGVLSTGPAGLALLNELFLPFFFPFFFLGLFFFGSPSCCLFHFSSDLVGSLD